VLVVRGHLDHVVRSDGATGEVLLGLAGRTVRLPAAWSKPLRSLLDGAALRVDELPDLGGLTADEALACARRLVREGVVVVDGTP
jgi:hypothetical protein